MSRSEIRIAGAGGQGVVTAGRILAEAAILSGNKATHSQVYGPQSRGGASRSDVVIDTAEIGFPLAYNLDLLIILSDKAYTKYQPEPDDHTPMIVDRDCAPDSTLESATIFPIVATARSVSGGVLATGVVALGVLQQVAGFVDADTLRQAVAARVPTKFKAMNLDALEAGMGLVGALP